MSHRLFPYALTALAVALVLPSLGAGLRLDDYALLAILSGSMGDLFPSRLDIFNFFGSDPGQMHRMLDLGLLPWWTFPGIRISFWRPVSALTHWLDYTLWRDLPALMHAQSLLWFGGLTVTVSLTYRRLMRPHAWAAGVAALLFALNGGALASAVTWVAGRNAILGTLFGTLALLFHDRWRRAGWRAGSLVAPACLALALLSSEGALAAGAYLVAYAVFLDHGAWRRRLAGLLPHGLVAAIWLCLYTGLGYGVAGAAPGYLNPLREPLAFGRAVVRNGPILLLAPWTGPEAEGFPQLPPGAADARWAGSLLALAVLAALLAPLLKQDASARFWGLGQVLAVVPACAAMPADRYLLFAGLGTMGLLARFLCSLVDREPWRPRRLLWKWPAVLLAGVLLAVHLIVFPLQLVRGATRVEGFDASVQQVSDSLPADPAIRSQLAVIVNVPSSVFVSYSLFIRAAKGQPIPAHTRLLASGWAPLDLYRADVHTLRVRWEAPQEHLFRAAENPLAVRERVRLTGTDVEVIRLSDDGWPVEAVFRFDRDLDDPALRWLRWATPEGDHGRFVSFHPPSIGETVLIR